MPNGNQSLLSFTDIFSQLGLDDKYLSMIQDPSKYFGLGQEYAKFFPGAEMYQQQLSTLLGTGEGSLAEREATLRGQVEQRYGIGTRGAEARYGLGTQATEERFRYGREQERERGTQSFLGLGEQFRQQQAQTGFTGGGAVKSGYSTAQQDITRGYGQRVGALGAARQQRLGELGASRTQAMEEFGAGKQRGMFGVEEDIAGLRGQAQSLMGQYIQSLFGIGRDLWASMPDITETPSPFATPLPGYGGRYENVPQGNLMRGGAAGSCFLAGTDVETLNGTQPIESVQTGDSVMSIDFKKKDKVTSKVTETFVHKNIDKYLIINDKIKTTPNHPFYSNGEWKEIGKLSIGDKILHSDGMEHTIESIEQVNEPVMVYNIEVDKHHNYFAEGYLVHNK